MLIYEVNLTVDEAISTEYSTWLREHIREMLTLDGFEAAAWYTRSDAIDTLPESDAPTGPRHWTIHYQVESRRHLQDYVEEHAETMRQDSTDRFGDQFSAERRILEQQRTFSHHNPDRTSPAR
jgi:hypothetical protein